MDILDKLHRMTAGPWKDEAIAEIERLRAERDHWYALVSRDDREQFPFEQSAPKREYDLGVAPCDDAEFGTKP